MRQSLPKTIFSYDKNSLAQLGNILKDYFKTKKDLSVSHQLNSVISPDLITLLNDENLDIIIKNQLVFLTKQGYKWNFLPVFNKNLLLFCDFQIYERNHQYVWLSTNISGRSWNFAESLPVKKTTRVLDLGTGTGLLALMARLKGGTALGVDINSRAVHLAQLNRDLNGLDLVEFQNCDWKSVDGHQFDLIVSQPPFGFSSGEISLGFAFNGGNITGLQATKEIIRQFCPQDNQTLMIYVHVLENKSHSRFRGLLQEWVADKSISISLKPHSRYSIKLWWEKHRKKQRDLNVTLLPPEFRIYHEVVTYFVYLTKN